MQQITFVQTKRNVTSFIVASFRLQRSSLRLRTLCEHHFLYCLFLEFERYQLFEELIKLICSFDDRRFEDMEVKQLCWVRHDKEDELKRLDQERRQLQAAAVGHPKDDLWWDNFFGDESRRREVRDCCFHAIAIRGTWVSSDRFWRGSKIPVTWLSPSGDVV